MGYGADFVVSTPDAGQINSVALLRPCAMTHHTDAGQRYIKVPIVSRAPNSITVRAPADGNIAPPGFYMLFLLTASGVPSEAGFIRVA